VNCSPHNKTRAAGCLDKTALIELRDLWNARHPDNLINSSSPESIYQSLQSNLQYSCANEICWFEQVGAMHEAKNKWMSSLFAPFSPTSWEKNPTEWLSSRDISEVMKQYEEAYPHFEFLGPSPIDFDAQSNNKLCVWPELCLFSLEDKIKSGINVIGIIFNTDAHDMPGQHWISLVIDLRNQYISFFDSTGDPIPSEIRAFVDRIIQQGLKMTPQTRLVYRDTEGIAHQRENTECGMYSLFFVINMLKNGISWNQLRNTRITDEHVKKFRRIYFNQSR
jgi:hypothetical protein